MLSKYFSEAKTFPCSVRVILLMLTYSLSRTVGNRVKSNPNNNPESEDRPPAIAPFHDDVLQVLGQKPNLAVLGKLCKHAVVRQGAWGLAS